ncbi:MAG: hypothetical protein NTW03_13160, partial [Verrucomicrobia bacterium]|nr:hypothetical protein [Verrucomicrobiota bacterium]
MRLIVTDANPHFDKKILLIGGPTRLHQSPHSAGFQPAVSRISNPQTLCQSPHCHVIPAPADWKSAISTGRWLQFAYVLAMSATEIIQELPKLSSAERRAVRQVLSELAA